ncbi:hypothetical protein ANN_16955 [Periplaneta americana]|uniref:PiggyBac transposable element-derived protein domain-containing protein n=1 Tax=Periplaneta americana TaxID=6978 RepID=A0ABQ8SS40_PERAM|nr:hypothetical protein ANN_16955 [Periplaneta americana]
MCENIDPDVYNISGVNRQNKDSVRELYSEENFPLYTATLSEHRFRLLLKCLRFDNSVTLEDRKKRDKFAPIRADPYAGQFESEQRNHKSGPEVVKSLVHMSNLEQSGRNITMDRKFISMFLATELLKEKVTTVDTMGSNRRDLPTELRPASLKNAQTGTARFAFTEDTTLISNVPKKGRVVTVLCTQHCDMKVTDDKPDIILFYNSTKAGVDVLDKCIRTYSCCRGKRRRPMSTIRTSSSLTRTLQIYIQASISYAHDTMVNAVTICMLLGCITGVKSRSHTIIHDGNINITANIRGNHGNNDVISSYSVVYFSAPRLCSVCKSPRSETRGTKLREFLSEASAARELDCSVFAGKKQLPPLTAGKQGPNTTNQQDSRVNAWYSGTELRRSYESGKAAHSYCKLTSNQRRKICDNMYTHVDCNVCVIAVVPEYHVSLDTAPTSCAAVENPERSSVTWEYHGCDVVIRDANNKLLKEYNQCGELTKLKPEEKEHLLLEAVKAEDTIKLKTLLMLGTKTGIFMSAIECAALSGSIQLVQIFLDRGIKASSECFITKMSFAMEIKRKAFHMDKDPLKYKKDLMLKVDDQCTTPIHFAAMSGSPSLVQYFIDLGENPQSINILGNTPLFYAARSGSLELAQLLVSLGSDPLIENLLDETPIVYAAYSGSVPMFELFLQWGADITSKGYERKSLLHIAAELGHLSLVQKLIGEGLDVNARDNAGRTPLHYAARAGQLSAVQALINAGALIIHHRKPTALDYAKFFNRTEVIEWLSRLNT